LGPESVESFLPKELEQHSIDCDKFIGFKAALELHKHCRVGVGAFLIELVEFKDMAVWDL